MSAADAEQDLPFDERLLAKRQALLEGDAPIYPYTYDSVGNVLSQTDDRGTRYRTEYRYDKLNRLTQTQTVDSQLSTLAAFNYSCNFLLNLMLCIVHMYAY